MNKSKFWKIINKTKIPLAICGGIIMACIIIFFACIISYIINDKLEQIQTTGVKPMVERIWEGPKNK